ncbi:hypothetical protein BIV57_03960 [Mangrovactinospora gilvigrisea]|uniref:Bacterial mobilisation domain-containing protein n=1 Tax=Mangrovactinospora gilvigrisea TaxID=1428644 RepID=A0A1J7CB71_9ACTN|nr:MobC family plasmid mobilization relaxosome protein [Mangrovactinospora gilvigrisea]OIV38772.1 hypothetical protein BIV57_03960 [Mangrovactinospora gilvigrisea]
MAGEGAAEGDRTQKTPPPDRPVAPAFAAVAAELDRIRPDDAPRIPAPLNRRRAREKRTVERKIRLTPSADTAIRQAAERTGKRPAGFIGDAALEKAYAVLADGEAVPSPEDVRERALAAVLVLLLHEARRQGVNLNQIARAVNTGYPPEGLAACAERLDELHTRIAAVLAEVHAHVRKRR